MKSRMSTIYDDDIQKLLKSIGELPRVEAGKVKCKSCGDVVTLATISFVFPEGNEVRYICNKRTCMMLFSDGDR